MADREKKRGRRKYKNLNLENEESFLDEIKSNFQSFWSTIFEVCIFEYNFDKKIAGISFNLLVIFLFIQYHHKIFKLAMLLVLLRK